MTDGTQKKRGKPPGAKTKNRTEGKGNPPATAIGTAYGHVTTTAFTVLVSECRNEISRLTERLRNPNSWDYPPAYAPTDPVPLKEEWSLRWLKKCRLLDADATDPLPVFHRWIFDWLRCANPSQTGKEIELPLFSVCLQTGALAKEFTPIESVARLQPKAQAKLEAFAPIYCLRLGAECLRLLTEGTPQAIDELAALKTMAQVRNPVRLLNESMTGKGDFEKFFVLVMKMRYRLFTNFRFAYEWRELNAAERTELMKDSHKAWDDYEKARKDKSIDPDDPRLTKPSFKYNGREKYIKRPTRVGSDFKKEIKTPKDFSVPWNALKKAWFKQNPSMEDNDSNRKTLLRWAKKINKDGEVPPTSPVRSAEGLQRIPVISGIKDSPP